MGHFTFPGLFLTEFLKATLRSWLMRTASEAEKALGGNYNRATRSRNITGNFISFSIFATPSFELEKKKIFAFFRKYQHHCCCVSSFSFKFFQSYKVRIEKDLRDSLVQCFSHFIVNHLKILKCRIRCSSSGEKFKISTGFHVMWIPLFHGPYF